VLILLCGCRFRREGADPLTALTLSIHHYTHCLLTELTLSTALYSLFTPLNSLTALTALTASTEQMECVCGYHRGTYFHPPCTPICIRSIIMTYPYLMTRPRTTPQDYLVKCMGYPSMNRGADRIQDHFKNTLCIHSHVPIHTYIPMY
jgi:hypothetical protein